MECHPVLHAEIARHPIDVGHHMTLVGGVRQAGATVVFTGQVRDHDSGRAVRSMAYTAHPQAGSVLERMAAVATSVAGVRGVALSHRIGELDIGDVALCCAVAADHRGQAIDVCSDLVEEVKHRLPVWKHQVFADGSDEWVGSP